MSEDLVRHLEAVALRIVRLCHETGASCFLLLMQGCAALPFALCSPIAREQPFDALSSASRCFARRRLRLAEFRPAQWDLNPVSSLHLKFTKFGFGCVAV